MRLGTRIFLCYFLIFAICFAYPINRILDDLRIRYLEGVEDPLVDQANILAALASIEMQESVFDGTRWHTAFDQAYARTLSALETRKDLETKEDSAVAPLLEAVIESKGPVLAAKDIAVVKQLHDDIVVKRRSLPAPAGSCKSPAECH